MGNCGAKKGDKKNAPLHLEKGTVQKQDKLKQQNAPKPESQPKEETKAAAETRAKQDPIQKTASVASKMENSPGSLTIEHVESKAEQSRLLAQLLPKTRDTQAEFVKSVYEDSKGINLDFCLNLNEEDQLAPISEGGEPISLAFATPIQVALASGNKQVVEYLLSREDASVVPRGDFASFE
jgi:hypothetical protein